MASVGFCQNICVYTSISLGFKELRLGTIKSSLTLVWSCVFVSKGKLEKKKIGMKDEKRQE